MAIPAEVQRDADILEAKLAALVDEFQQKHKPWQPNIISMSRDWKDKYQVAKGGSVQIILRDKTPYLDLGYPIRSVTGYFDRENRTFFYTDEGEGL